MKKYFRMNSCWWLLLLCLPLQSKAQYDSTLADYIRKDSIEALKDTVAHAVNLENTGEEQYEDRLAYEPRQVAPAVLKELKADERLKYRDEKITPAESPNWLGRFLGALFSCLVAIRGFIMVLLLAGLGFLLYRFMKSNGLSIFRKPALIDGLAEIQEEELHSAQEYEEKIKAAIAAGDTRQAIRWWYLYTLFQLAGKQLIVAGREKTNNDYLRNMRSSPYYKKFATLTLDYEYIWYGGFEVSEENFREINQEFRDFNNAIGKAS